ncbi:glutathione peroxidase [Pelagibius sp. CAU 1746]|uniref:glutathione peroxidase n=1 Tax=Pelagibius sp. CAU 1746 TaxID=3140370 RepID=UPI00325BF919
MFFSPFKISPPRLLLFALLALAAGPLGGPAAAAEPAASAHDFAFTSIEGQPLPLSQFKGKVVLLVNTASRCGFTPQYEGLQAVWERYRDRGLVVLGVPSNDFGGQEPGSEAEIKQFCEVNFSVDFPLTSKEQVVGEAAHPFYRWAAAQLGFAAKPRWNFHKYLIGPDGALVDWFATTTKPTAAKVTKAIEAQLSRVAQPES